MRIIAGSRKGMRLEVPRGLAVRPTPGRVREAAMSILGGFLDGERVLDLCAGSGAIGLELVSRGAGAAVLVEPDPAALQALRRNVERARCGDKVRVLAMQAQAAIAQLSKRGERFDLVWLDPPWDAGLHAPLLRALSAAGLVAPGGEVLVESPQGVEAELLGPGFAAVDRRGYGAVTLERFRRVAEDGGAA